MVTDPKITLEALYNKQKMYLKIKMANHLFVCSLSSWHSQILVFEMVSNTKIKINIVALKEQAEFNKAWVTRQFYIFGVFVLVWMQEVWFRELFHLSGKWREEENSSLFHYQLPKMLLFMDPVGFIWPQSCPITGNRQVFCFKVSLWNICWLQNVIDKD